MAPKQPAALKNPPPADTSSEEEEESDEEVPETQTKTPQKPDSSSEEEDTSSDEEEEDKENKKPDQKSDSDSDEDEEVDEKKKPDSDLEEEESDTESADTKKVEEVVLPKPPIEVVIASPAAKSIVSNQKKGKAYGADEKKSPAFTRVFGDDDEVAVLKGMDEFRKKTGRDPNVDRDGFFEFMKKSLKIEVSKSQLMDKVKRLKKKYQTHVKKGDNPVITKPHELKLYELSKKVWGGDVAESAVKAVKRKAVKNADVASAGAKSNKKAKMNVDVGVKENGAGLELVEKAKSDPEGWDAFPHFKEVLEVESSGYYFKRLVDFNKIGAKKAKEMDDLWRAYHAKELELKSARVELQEKTTKLLRDTLES